MRKAEIIISGSDGLNVVRAEIAETKNEKETGLSRRTALLPGAGMYFPIDPAMPARIWMRDALIPLDIAFIGVDGVVTGLVEAAQPGSERMFWSPGFASGVLEVGAGDARRLGVQPGARLSYA